MKADERLLFDKKKIKGEEERDIREDNTGLEEKKLYYYEIMILAGSCQGERCLFNLC